MQSRALKLSLLLATLLVTVLLVAPLAIAAGSNWYDHYLRPMTAGLQIQIYKQSVNIISTCSLGFPVYKARVVYVPDPLDRDALDISPTLTKYYLTEYGYVTASHCGDESDPVYQPVYGIDLYYIGKIYIDGRKKNDGSIDTSKPVDAAYIKVESYGSFDGYQPPQKVSNRVQIYYNGVVYNATIVGAVSSFNDIPYDADIYAVGVEGGFAGPGILDSSGVYFSQDAGAYIKVYDFTGEMGKPGNSGGLVFYFADEDMTEVIVIGTLFGSNDSDGDGVYDTVYVAPVWYTMDMLDDYGYKLYLGYVP